jgi:DNA (cytosine-5)-methyltransferase 1
MRFYEFFSGAGMARLGFGANMRCLFANDIDSKKCTAYTRNFGGAELLHADICTLSAADLPGRPDVVFASPPCQELSAAGHRAGLNGPRSGMVFPFLRLMNELAAEQRAPRMIVIENVEDLVTSHGGRDLATLVDQISAIGYRVGALVVDAALFLPQSRRRVFVIAVHNDITIPGTLVKSRARSCWHPPGLQQMLTHVSAQARRGWIWWTLPRPAPRTSTLADVIEADPKGTRWDSAATTAHLLAKMSETHRAKVAVAQRIGRLTYGAMSQHTRCENGTKIQRVEVRFDGLAGCLRASDGGSSRQRLIVIDGDDVRSRFCSPREAARLMGLPEDYGLPARFGDAMRLIGDGVVVPVVQHLTEHLIMPILRATVRRPAPATVSSCPGRHWSCPAIERLTVQGRPLSLERTHSGGGARPPLRASEGNVRKGVANVAGRL